MYLIEVDRTKCIGCGVCYNLDPTHFEADWENKSGVVGGTGHEVSVANYEDELHDDVQKAVESCPVSAITMIKVQSEINPFGDPLGHLF